MKFTVEVNCDNAAFEDEGPVHEIRRILQALAKTVVYYGHGQGSLLDINGNIVGRYTFTE
jgi:hypothetical protein